MEFPFFQLIFFLINNETHSVLDSNCDLSILSQFFLTFSTLHKETTKPSFILPLHSFQIHFKSYDQSPTDLSIVFNLPDFEISLSELEKLHSSLVVVISPISKSLFRFNIHTFFLPNHQKIDCAFDNCILVGLRDIKMYLIYFSFLAFCSSPKEYFKITTLERLQFLQQLADKYYNGLDPFEYLSKYHKSLIKN